jgi:hypothetical protein
MSHDLATAIEATEFFGQANLENQRRAERRAVLSPDQHARR